MEIIYADTFFKRFKGLMGKKNFDYIMVFTNLTDSSIHTMFMRFEIDIYFVDKNGVILSIIYDKTKPARGFPAGLSCSFEVFGLLPFESH